MRTGSRDPAGPRTNRRVSALWVPPGVVLWVKQEARDRGKGDGGLTTAEREELNRLRRENRKLKEEREILAKAAAWFATESGLSKRSSGS